GKLPRQRVLVIAERVGMLLGRPGIEVEVVLLLLRDARAQDALPVGDSGRADVFLGERIDDAHPLVRQRSAARRRELYLDGEFRAVDAARRTGRVVLGLGRLGLTGMLAFELAVARVALGAIDDDHHPVAGLQLYATLDVADLFGLVLGDCG